MNQVLTSDGKAISRHAAIEMREFSRLFDALQVSPSGIFSRSIPLPVPLLPMSFTTAGKRWDP